MLISRSVTLSWLLRYGNAPQCLGPTQTHCRLVSPMCVLAPQGAVLNYVEAVRGMSFAKHSMKLVWRGTCSPVRRYSSGRATDHVSLALALSLSQRPQAGSPLTVPPCVVLKSFRMRALALRAKDQCWEQSTLRWYVACGRNHKLCGAVRVTMLLLVHRLKLASDCCVPRSSVPATTL